MPQALSRLLSCDWRRGNCPVYGMNHLKSSDVSITVIEAADRILPALPNRLSAAATKELGHQHVEVLNGQPVSEIRPGVVVLKDGTELPSRNDHLGCRH